MGTNEKTNRLLCLIFMLNILISPSFGILGIKNGNIADGSFKPFSQVEPRNMEESLSFEDDLIYFPHLAYVPIESSQGDGDSFTISDELSVSAVSNMYLNSSNDWEEILDVQGLTGFATDYMEFGLTVTGVRDNYTINEGSNRGEILDATNIRIAQGFQITWEYGVFYGAEMNLQTTGPTLGNQELEIFVVKADISGLPNMNDIRAFESNGPYNSTNNLPSNTWYYYNFQNMSLGQETILEQGSYFVVANLSVYGSGSDSFLWEGHIATVAGFEMYHHDGTSWSLENEMCNVKVDLKPSEADGSVKVFSDLTEIYLRDGPNQILTHDQEITSTGPHPISSGNSLITRTSLYLELNNSYYFSDQLTASSRFLITNSSYLSNSANWYVTWSSDVVNILTYSNAVREFSFLTPIDWSNLSFSLLVDNSIPISGERNHSGYSFDCGSIIVGNEFPASTFNFTTTSLNYLNNLILDSNVYNLGYWTTNETHAIGHDGSIVNADIYVKDSASIDVLDGELNFTIYDPNGNIVPIKDETDYINISYTDITSYTFLETSQFSPGRYMVSTVFDPSINGTDIEGQWSATCFWQNGTEVGFYSLTISVTKSTTASFSWEETFGGNDYTNSSVSINRMNSESVNIRILYNNISDPFYSGDGTPITAAPVAYNTSWGTSGFLNYVDPYYESDILIDAVAGNHSITLTASGQSLETHTITFDVSVYHTFTINPSSGGNFQAYYNDEESYVQFTVVDTSNYSNSVIPDEMAFYLDDVLLVKAVDYGVREFAVTNLLQLELFSDTSGLDLFPGSYSIRISVAKQGFIVNYGQENATTTVNLEILTIPTTIDIVSSDDEVYWGNETIITFYYVDTIHTDNIPEVASLNISLDLSPADAEIIGVPTENLRLYSVTIRIHEPQETSINVFISISKPGYETKSNQLLKSISITAPPGPVEGIPFYIYIIIGIFTLAALVTPLSVFVRRKLDKNKRSEKALFARIYGLYESVLSITKIIIVHNLTGLPVYEMDLGSEISLDPSLITGFLTAIASMGVELRDDKAGSIRRLQYKNFSITGSESGQFTLYTFSETDLNEEIERQLTVISEWFAKMFSSIREDWDGSTEVFRVNLQGITEKIMKEIYLWIFYPFTVSLYKQAEIEEFNGLQKRLVEYIIDGDNVTISRIFDELDDIRIEKGLPIIFEFIENGILIPVFDAYKIATVRF